MSSNVEWSCSMCTLVNKPEISSCEACGNMRQQDGFTDEEIAKALDEQLNAQSSVISSICLHDEEIARALSESIDDVEDNDIVNEEKRSKYGDWSHAESKSIEKNMKNIKKSEVSSSSISIQNEKDDEDMAKQFDPWKQAEDEWAKVESSQQQSRRIKSNIQMKK